MYVIPVVEDGGVAHRVRDGRSVRRAICVRAAHMDGEGAGARLQEAVRGACQQETQAYRRPHFR